MLPITKVPGVEFDFGGGRTFVVPPLTLNAFKQLRQRGVDLTQLSDLNAESIDTVIAATHSALSRNYPELTVDDVGELLDLANIPEVLQCVLDVSGLKRRAVEAEKAAAGKALGATTSETSTGTS